MLVHCVAICKNFLNETVHYPVTLEMPEEDILFEGLHYEEARVAATMAGYQDVTHVYDQFDECWPMYRELFPNYFDKTVDLCR